MPSIQNPEHFVYDHASERWGCLACSGGLPTTYMTLGNAVRHETGGNHARAVALRTQHMNAANAAAENLQSSSIVASTSDNFINSIMDVVFTTNPGPTHPIIDSTSPNPAEVLGASEHLDDHGTLFTILQAEFSDTTALDSDDEEPPGDIGDGIVEFAREDPPPTTHPLLPSSNTEATDGDQPWRPWPDLLTCSIELVSHLPRSLFSEGELEAIIWLLKTNGLVGVPSITQMKASATRLKGICGIEPSQRLGSLGHSYHLLPPSLYVALDFANPSVRRHLECYPEDSGQELRAACQAHRWLNEADPALLTPMYRHQHCDFFTFEPTYLNDRSVCMPSRWFRKGGMMWCRAWRMSVHSGETGTPLGWIIEQGDEFTFPVDQLCLSGKDLFNGAPLGYRAPSTHVILGVRRSHELSNLDPWTHPLLNPWRVKAQGARVFTYPVWLYCDDTSGNTSKKWNEHNSYLMVAAGLPRQHASKEINIHFLCTSNAAPPLEMLEGIVDDIEACQRDGCWVYDSVYHEKVLVIIWVLALLGDNPMQSEFACHAGLKAKFFCRSCWVKGKDVGDMDNNGGPKKSENQESMVERIRRFMTIGRARSCTETQHTSEQMLESAVMMEPASKIQSLRTSTGVKDTFLRHFLEKIEKAKRKLTGSAAEDAVQMALHLMPVKERIVSPVWRLHDLNPHSDTPVEILHVILLGFLKYFWRDAVGRLSDDNKEVLKIRLNSMDVRGLDPAVSALRGQTLVRYAGSLVGRDFKLLDQVAVFALYDLLEPPLLETWAALCALVPLVWQPEIDNLDVYLLRLEKAINHFLNCTALWTLRWFNKPKFHLLLHLLSHVRRFGPATLFATEVFESFNAIIRAWSIHSNRLAPSRDISNHAAHLARIRHLMSGGYYEVEIEGANGQPVKKWVTAGPSALGLGRTPSAITQKLGICPKLIVKPGTIHLSTRQPLAWTSTQSSKHYQYPGGRNARVQFGTSIVANNGDTIHVNQFVAFVSAAKDTHIAKVHEILTSHSDESFGLRVLLQHYEVGTTVFPYHMPRLVPQAIFSLAQPPELICSVNVQHNCAAHSCNLSGTRVVYLERQIPVVEKAVKHVEPEDIILNTAKIRDAKIIQLFTTPQLALDRSSVVHHAVFAELARN